MKYSRLRIVEDAGSLAKTPNRRAAATEEVDFIELRQPGQMEKFGWHR
jgi:hypothetical protein